MKLVNLSRQYANYQITAYNHSFTKPTPRRAYIKLLEAIASVDFCPHSKIFNSKELPSVMTLPRLEAKGFIEHYREGRNTFWKITESGKALVRKAYESLKFPHPQHFDMIKP